MRDVVLHAWIGFTESLEGGVSWLYNDVRGMTTIAYGNLVNTPSGVLSLPMVHAGGAPATKAEIAVAWQRVHSAPPGMLASQYAKLTDLRLPRDAMTDLALARLHMNNAELVRQLPDFEDFPACAQMALHSWAWAGGPDDYYPKMMAALHAGDFATAALEIFMKEITPEGIVNAGLVKRNKRNKILMCNAAYVRDAGLDPDMLNWDIDLRAAAAETQPELEDPPSNP